VVRQVADAQQLADPRVQHVVAAEADHHRATRAREGERAERPEEDLRSQPQEREPGELQRQGGGQRPPAHAAHHLEHLAELDAAEGERETEDGDREAEPAREPTSPRVAHPPPPRTGR
jgi:hypothetical protein